jgi:hypothetical protein
LFVEGILMIILMQMNQMCWIFFCIYYHIFNSVVPMCSIYFYQFLRGCEHPFTIYQLAFQGYHFDLSWIIPTALLLLQTRLPVMVVLWPPNGCWNDSGMIQ